MVVIGRISKAGIIAGLIAAALACAFVVALPSSAMAADSNAGSSGDSFKLTATKITFSKKNSWSYGYIERLSGSKGIVKAKSSEKRVATVKVEHKGSLDAYVRVTPKKAGTTTITVRDAGGAKQKVKVKVKKSYFKANLKSSTMVSIPHRAKQVTIRSLPDTVVTLKIGGKSYTKRTNSKGNATIKHVKGFNSKKKFTVIAQKGKDKTTIKGKVHNNTSAHRGTLHSNSHSMPITVYNVKKGDRVILMLDPQETHKIKVKKSEERYHCTFTTKYLMSDYKAYRIIVKSSKGKKLYDSKQQFILWR